MTPAVVLLSGGLDSATTAALAARDGFSLYALTFNYGQRHACELLAAEAIARNFRIRRHVIQTIDLRAFGGSALTDNIPVPKHGPDPSLHCEIPVTYVPARNTIFLAFALAFAETIGATDIFIGVNAVDYSGYPDCRPEFIAKFQELARLATRSGIEGHGAAIRAPLISLTKADIIRTGIALGVDYSRTISCYDPDAAGRACGDCDSCVLRRTGFEQAGVPDPTRYQRPVDRAATRPQFHEVQA